VAFEVFKPVADVILDALNSWSGAADAIVGGWLYQPMLAGLTLLLTWRGLNAIRGAGAGLVVVDAVLASLRVTLVWWLALTGGSYLSNVVGTVLALRNDFTTLFIPGASDAYTALDVMMDKGIETMKLILAASFENISIVPTDLTGVVSLGAGLIMLLCMAVFGVVSAVNLLFVDLALAFLAAVGPVFVAAFAFQSTARFFDAWLGSALKYVFTSVLVTAVTSMAIGVMARYGDRLAATVETVDYLVLSFGALGAAGVLIFFAARAPHLAADIAGGIAVQALALRSAAGPLGAAASLAGQGARRGAGVVGNAAAYAAGSVAGSSVGQAVVASAPAQAALHAASRMSSTLSTLGGSMADAYAAGRGGSISGANSGGPGSTSRPLASPAGSRSLPPLSAQQQTSAASMQLAA
jgi:type IV secretion system protein VirB6